MLRTKSRVVHKSRLQQLLDESHKEDTDDASYRPEDYGRYKGTWRFEGGD